jgi:peptidoglycan-N-acetylglucosamine deacetylase
MPVVAHANPDADLERAWLLAEGPSRSAHPGRRLVTFTFDDGPGPRTTDAVLKVLAAHHVKAAFFMVSSYFEGPSKRAARIRKAAEAVAGAGHLIGNHTAHHRKLVGLSESELDIEVGASAKLIEEVTHVKPTLFRPPFGALDAPAQRAVKASGADLTMWTVEARDMLRVDTNRMMHDLTTQLDYGQGGIVLLHDVKWATVRALDELLIFLESNKYDAAHPERAGYEIVDLPTYAALTQKFPQPYRTRYEMNQARERERPAPMLTEGEAAATAPKRAAPRGRKPLIERARTIRR